jgi:hypothetical protein
VATVFVCPFDIRKVPILNAVVDYLLDSVGKEVVILTNQNGNGNALRRKNFKLLNLTPLDNEKRRGAIFRYVWRYLGVIKFYVNAFNFLKNGNTETVIFVNDLAMLLSPFRLAEKQTFWQLEFKPGSNINIRYKILGLISNFLWRFVDFAVFPSGERMALAIGTGFGTCNLQSYIIPNTRSKSELSLPLFETMKELSHLQSDERIRDLREFIRSQRNSGRQILIYSGAVGKYTYNLEPLITSLGQLSNIALIIVGIEAVSLKAYFGDLISKSYLSDRSILSSFIDNAALQYILRDCDIGFVSYRAQDMNTMFSAPGKVFQYLANGLKIVSDCSYARSLVSTGATYLFEANLERDALVEEIREAIRSASYETSPSRIEIINIFNRNYAAENFDNAIKQTFC